MHLRAVKNIIQHRLLPDTKDSVESSLGISLEMEPWLEPSDLSRAVAGYVRCGLRSTKAQTTNSTTAHTYFSKR